MKPTKMATHVLIHVNLGLPMTVRNQALPELKQRQCQVVCDTSDIDEIQKFRGKDPPQPHLVKRFDIVCRNKTGTSQVGAISKAQKNSRNNKWKHLETFFFKKVFCLKSRTMPENSERVHLGSLNVFYKPKTSKKRKG